jgi:ketosteroid isomerase-like protein
MQEGSALRAANKEVVRRFIGGIVTDPGAAVARATMAEDAVWSFELAGGYSPELKAFTGPTRWTREQMIEMQLAFQKQLAAPYRFEIRQLVAEDDNVVADVIGRGVSKASGRPYEQRYSFHLVVRDGLIREGRVYQDTLHLWDIWMHSASRDFFLDLTTS